MIAAPNKAIPLIALAAMLAYSNCVTKSMHLDDFAEISRNGAIDNPLHFLSEMGHRSRMFGYFTFTINHAMNVDTPTSYHIVNVSIHIFAGLTLYGLIRRTLVLPRFQGRYDDHANGLALTVALLWVLHPLCTQAVTYVVQRFESMMGLFYLLSLYTFLRGATTPSPVRAAGWNVLTAGSIVLGFGSKEIIVTAPVAILLFDRLFVARTVGEMVRKRWTVYGTLLVLLLSMLKATIGFADDPQTAQGGAGFQLVGLKPIEYLYSQAEVLPHYVWLAIWPDKLCFDYKDWPVARSIYEVWLPGAVICAVLLTSVILLFARVSMGFVIFWFFLVLAPSSSIVPIVDMAFEHRMYLSLISIITLITFAGYWLLDRSALADTLGPVCVGVLALALGVRTYVRNEDYLNEATLYDRVIELRPKNGRAYINASYYYVNQEDFAKTLDYLKLAEEYASQDIAVYINKGIAEEGIGKLDAAEKTLKHAAAMGAGKIDVSQRHYGWLLALRGQPQKGIEFLRESVRLDVSSRVNRYQLIVACRAGREALPTTESIPLVEAMGVGGLAAGVQDCSMKLTAEKWLPSLTANDPYWHAALNRQARDWLFFSQPDARAYYIKGARLYAETALEVAGASAPPAYYDTLGLALAAEGRFPEAVKIIEAALAVPDITPTWKRLFHQRIAMFRRGEAVRP